MEAQFLDKIEFGTDGWRAVIAEQFTFENVERVTHAIGAYVLQTFPSESASASLPVLIGYDTRFLADRFAYRAAQVLSEMGITPKLSNHDLPTPCLAFAAQREPSAGAMQITASHNPPEYCGIKYITPFGGPATNDITAKIVGHLQDETSFSGSNIAIVSHDFKPPYVDAITKLVDLPRIGASKLRIGYDALYSTSRGYLDVILEKAGVELKVLHNWRDPNFGGVMPEPKKEYLKELMGLVKAHQCDGGIATDGDADRFAVIDERGEYMWPNQLLCLLARHLVKNRGFGGAIVRTVATTHMLDRVAQRYGLELIETPVGFKYIGEQMRSRDVLIGGEESGGVSIKGHIPEKDGILANLLILEMMAYESKALSRIWQDLVSEIGKPLVGCRADLKLHGNVQKALMARLAAEPFENLAGAEVSKVSQLDGIKFYIDNDNWVLVRASGTEPLLRLYSEADSQAKAEALVADSKHKLEETLTSLENSAKLSVQRDIAKMVP
jgi:phosphomannomutase